MPRLGPAGPTLADVVVRAEIWSKARETDAVSDEYDDWEVSPRAQPKAADYGFDLDRALSAVVGLSARVGEDAYTAETLGIERGGNGVVIHEDGVVLTIGYLITEAEEVLLETHRGRVVPGHVLGYDGSTGFGLVQALEPLGLPALKLGDSRHAGVGEPVILAGAGGRRHSVAAEIGLCAHLFVVVVPRAGPFRPSLALIFRRIDRDAMTGPQTKSRLEPILGRFRLVCRDSLPQHRRTRLTLLDSARIQPADVLIGKVGQNTSHDDISISYRDIIIQFSLLS